jgi:hypothetical protein
MRFYMGDGLRKRSSGSWTTAEMGISFRASRRYPPPFRADKQPTYPRKQRSDSFINGAISPSSLLPVTAAASLRNRADI